MSEAQLPSGSWIARCSARLQQRWRSIDPQRLDDLALELMREERWRRMEPEAAAVAWLRQGIPDA